MNRKAFRLWMVLATVVLLAIECCIGLFAHGWLRTSFGDILVVILIYTFCRAVSPEKPTYGWVLPMGILLFAFCVEFLQLWGFVDKMHITHPLLRTIIGTGFAAGDLLCYAAGILPCLLFEIMLKRYRLR